MHDWLERTAGMTTAELWDAFFAANPMIYGDLLEWTNLFPRNTGLPVTIWVNIHGAVATNPYWPEEVEHRAAVTAWMAHNREVLALYATGAIDGVEMALRTQPLP